MTRIARNDLLDNDGSSPSPRGSEPLGRAGKLKNAGELYRRHAHAEAEAIARDLTVEDPGDLAARTLLAACLYKQGQVAEALDHVEAALASWPEDEDLAVLRDIFMQALAAELWVTQRLCA